MYCLTVWVENQVFIWWKVQGFWQTFTSVDDKQLLRRKKMKDEQMEWKTLISIISTPVSSNEVCLRSISHAKFCSGAKLIPWWAHFGLWSSFFAWLQVKGKMKLSPGEFYHNIQHRSKTSPRDETLRLTTNINNNWDECHVLKRQNTKILNIVCWLEILWDINLWIFTKTNI